MAVSSEASLAREPFGPVHDPELFFGCRDDGPPLPSLLAQHAPPLPGTREERELGGSYAGIVATVAKEAGAPYFYTEEAVETAVALAVPSGPPAGGYGYDALDVLPLVEKCRPGGAIAR